MSHCNVAWQTKQALAEKLNRPEIMRADLSEYEKVMADEVLDPSQIETGFDDIGGLEQEKKEVIRHTTQPWQQASASHVVCSVTRGGRPYVWAAD